MTHARSMDANTRQLLAVTHGMRLQSGNGCLRSGNGAVTQGRRLHSGKGTVTHGQRLHSGHGTVRNGRRLKSGTDSGLASELLQSFQIGFFDMR